MRLWGWGRGGFFLLSFFSFWVWFFRGGCGADFWIWDRSLLCVEGDCSMKSFQSKEGTNQSALSIVQSEHASPPRPGRFSC